MHRSVVHDDDLPASRPCVRCISVRVVAIYARLEIDSPEVIAFDPFMIPTTALVQSYFAFNHFAPKYNSHPPYHLQIPRS